MRLVVRGPLAVGALAVVLAGVTPAVADAETGAREATAVVPACSDRWVAAWASNPADGNTDAALTDATVRQQAFLHTGGSSVRVHLSNRLSTAAVTFTAASVGEQATGPALVPGSEHALTFGGARSLTLAPGAEALSDPVAMPVRQFENLLVSLSAASMPKASEHHFGAETSWWTANGSGDHTGDLSSTAFTTVHPSEPVANDQGEYYVDRVDVLAPGSVGLVAAVGDSLTDGYQAELVPSALSSYAQIDKNTRYPDDLARRLAAAGRPLSVVNDGIAGDQITADGTSMGHGPSIIARLGPDVLAQPGLSDVILFAGDNDLGLQPLITAADLEAADTTIISRLHAAGVRVVLTTMTPGDTSVIPGYGVAGDLVRAQFNAWVRTQKVSDAFADFAAAVADPTVPTMQDPKYNGGDGVHLNAAGYQALADAVPLSALAAPVCATAAAPARVVAKKPAVSKVSRTPRRAATPARAAGGGGTLAYTGGPPWLFFTSLGCIVMALCVRFWRACLANCASRSGADENH